MPDSSQSSTPPPQVPRGEAIRPVDLRTIDQRFERYRLVQPRAEQLLLRSLRDYGQISPVVVCRLEGCTVLVDGFKRLRAARILGGFERLAARWLEVDESSAKAAIFNLNRLASKPVELEEAWLIQALINEDGLSQVEVARMLGRHKSWINRRLALLDKLGDEAREALRLGLLTPTQARHLTRLPRGNQNAVLRTSTEHSLASRELSTVVDLLLASGTSEQTAFVLARPREAIRQSQDTSVRQWDPRLSAAGNRIARRLGLLLDCSARMNGWLRLEGRGQLQACDREPLVESFTKLGEEACLLAEGTRDFLQELRLP